MRRHLIIHLAMSDITTAPNAKKIHPAKRNHPAYFEIIVCPIMHMEERLTVPTLMIELADLQASVGVI